MFAFFDDGFDVVCPGESTGESQSKIFVVLIKAHNCKLRDNYREV